MELKTTEESLKPQFRYLNKGKPMTITFGIKCVNGIVVAADSQSEFERGVDVKRLNANKLRVFDGRFIFAGAGVLVHIDTLVENVMDFIQIQEKQQRSHLNKDEVEKVTEQALWALVKHYNIDRSDALGIPRGDYFCPIVTFAGGNKIDDRIIYYLYFLHSDGTIEPISDYGAAGSGAAYAELLVKGLYSEAINVDEGIRIAAYVTDEVKSIDPHCGGDTQWLF